MKNSPNQYPISLRSVAALAILALAACTPPAKTETKVASADSARQMPMNMSTNMPMDSAMRMGRMMGGCPLNLASLALTPAQKATFDSVKADHKVSMQREMVVSLARARAVLTPAQRVTFDSASALHMEQMTKMMSAGGGCML